jgi:hypothetical protein
MGVVNTTPRPLYPGKDPVPLVQEGGWTTEPIWAGTKDPAVTGIRSADRSELLYRLSYLRLTYVVCTVC